MASSNARRGATGAVHVHSDYSHDGRDSLAKVRDWADAAGIGFVAMTDHAEDFDKDRFEHYAAECATLSTTRVKLIPGLEFRFQHVRGLHLLACGLREWITPATPDAFADIAPSVSAFTIVAHPVLARYRMPPAVWNRIDAVEVWNASYNTRYLPDPDAIHLFRALRCVRPDVVAIAGLDQHDASNDRGTRVVLTDADGHLQPLEALRAGRFVNHGRTMWFSPRVDWPRPGLATLSAARAIFDRVERVHDHVTRAIRRRRARNAQSGQGPGQLPRT